MMQIFIDAIEKSRSGNTQYVLQKSLEMVRVSDKDKLLSYLQDGWEIAGKFNYGVSLDVFVIKDCKAISCISNFIENEDIGVKIEPYAYISIKESFDNVFCKRKNIKCFVSFVWYEKGNLRRRNLYFTNENAEKIRDFIYILGIKRDKESIIKNA